MSDKKTVWYIAAGYKLPAGIEGYLLNYATEIRNHGYVPRIIVFEPLPAEKHRYLKSLEDRGIEIISLHSLVRSKASIKASLLFAPWLIYMLVVKRLKPDLALYGKWIFHGMMVSKLRNMIESECPNIIHVKGRLIAQAWQVFPSDRTIYHHALSGTVDPSWGPIEVDAFRGFADRIARIFAPGENVAKVLAREFRIDRPIDSIFTMCQDECGGEISPRAVGDQARRGATRDGERAKEDAEHIGAKLRYGILCRFTEQKGIKYILEALRMFKEKYGDVDFTFAGFGELEDMISSYLEDNDLSNVRITRVSTPYDVLKDIDVFVHPGLDDAMPVSIVEALMCSCPCIATDVGGVPDLVRSGKEGFLIQPESADEIFDCMCKFADMSTVEFDEFRNNARNRYEHNCTPEKVGDVFSGYYNEILDNNSNL